MSVLRSKVMSPVVHLILALPLPTLAHASPAALPQASATDALSACNTQISSGADIVVTAAKREQRLRDVPLDASAGRGDA